MERIKKKDVMNFGLSKLDINFIKSFVRGKIFVLNNIQQKENITLLQEEIRRLISSEINRNFDENVISNINKNNQIKDYFNKIEYWKKFDNSIKQIIIKTDHVFGYNLNYYSSSDIYLLLDLIFKMNINYNQKISKNISKHYKKLQLYGGNKNLSLLLNYILKPIFGRVNCKIYKNETDLINFNFDVNINKRKKYIISKIDELKDFKNKKLHEFVITNYDNRLTFRKTTDVERLIKLKDLKNEKKNSCW